MTRDDREAELAFRFLPGTGVSWLAVVINASRIESADLAHVLEIPLVPKLARERAVRARARAWRDITTLGRYSSDEIAQTWGCERSSVSAAISKHFPAPKPGLARCAAVKIRESVAA